MSAEHAIEAESLVREFKKGPRAVDGIDLAVAPGEIYGFLGPNGAGKSTTVLMLTTLLPPTSGTARVGGFDVVKHGPEVRRVIGAALQEAALDPLLTGREHLRLQASLQALPRARARAARRRAARARRPHRGGRPQGPRLLGRDEAPARPRARARPPPADPLPRRADDRPRHPEPHGALGGGAPAREGRRRHRLPHDAVPRGGRRARRPRRDHRPRPDRRRGHARPRSRPRSAARPSRSFPPTPPRQARAAAILARFGEPVTSRARRRRAAADGPGRPRRDRARARQRGPRGRAAPAAPAVARRRVPRQDRPLARGRRRRGGTGAGGLAMEPA